MTDENDWIDKLLRAKRIAHIQDDGFTESLMRRLPPRRRDAPRWIIPAAASIGAVMAAMASNGHLLSSAVNSLINQHHFEAVAVLPILLIWAACAWAVSETR
jgi:uncharacterized BrkB/YihY/UPF0761 family membrane protein